MEYVNGEVGVKVKIDIREPKTSLGN